MSLDELGSISQGIESGQGSQEGKENISDAMREAVRDQARKGKAIAGQIAQSKAQNEAYAKFLAFLLAQIKSNELLSLLYKLFFTTKDPYHGTIYIRKSTNYPVLIGLFVPFFRNKVLEYKMSSLYSPLFDPNATLTPQSYLHYLKTLANAMHDQIALDQELLLQCIMHIFGEFHLVNLKSLPEHEFTQLQALIKKELY